MGPLTEGRIAEIGEEIAAIAVSFLQSDDTESIPASAIISGYGVLVAVAQDRDELLKAAIVMILDDRELYLNREDLESFCRLVIADAVDKVFE